MIKGIFISFIFLIFYCSCISSESNNIKIPEMPQDILMVTKLMEKNEFYAALTSINKIIKKGSSLPVTNLSLAYYVRAEIYMLLGDVKIAFNDIEKSISIYPFNSYIYYRKGFHLAQQGNHEHAIENFNYSIKLDSTQYDAYYSRANSYCKTGRIKKGIEEYSNLISINNNNWRAYHARGLSYARLNKLDKAILDFQEAINLNPTFVQIYRDCGFAYQELKNYRESLKYYCLAIKIDSSDAESIYFRANLYLKMEYYSKACLDYKNSFGLGFIPAKDMFEGLCNSNGTPLEYYIKYDKSKD